MDDLISRQAAMTMPVLPKEHRDYISFELDDIYEQGWNECQSFIAKLPSADRPRWIPCSERLPEIEREGQRRGWYITTNGYGSVGMTQYEFYHDLLKTGWQSEHQIVAWMPKPEPYKRGDTND